MMRSSFLVLFCTLLISLVSQPVAAQSTPAAGGDWYAPDGAGRLVAMSPDGSMVAGTEALANDTLCTWSVRTGVVIACADLADAGIAIHIEDIAWSPDSAAIAFSERTWFSYTDGDLWSMNATTGALANLTDDGYRGKLPFGSTVDFEGPIHADVLPRWSPDGARIAFSRTSFLSDGRTPSGLWVLDAAYGKATEIAEVSDHELALIYFGLAWSPDARSLYATIAHQQAGNPENGVWQIDVNTGASKHIVAATADFDGAFPAVIEASPNGQWLSLFYPAYLTANPLPKGTGYALLRLATGAITPIAAPVEIAGDLPAPVYLPGFTPDGLSLVYAVRRYGDGTGLVQRRDLATGAEQTIATTTGGVFPTPISHGAGMVITPDGMAFVPVSLTTGLFVELP